VNDKSAEAAEDIAQHPVAQQPSTESLPTANQDKTEQCTDSDDAVATKHPHQQAKKDPLLKFDDGRIRFHFSKFDRHAVSFDDDAAL
jgi:hypothetical protein